MIPSMSTIAEGVEGLVGLARRANKLAVGYEACERTVAKKQAALIILANDLSPASAARLRRRLTDPVIPLIVHGRKSAWGRLLGREEVGILTILDQGLAAAITEKLNSGVP